MTESEKYEILSSLPAYGPMYIPISESGEVFYSEGFPVRFFKSDGTTWVANFKIGWTDLKYVYKLLRSSNLLVIAGGICYLMTPEDTRPISVFGVGYSTILIAEDGRLVLQDDTSLTIIETNGDHWDTERISWDGIKSLKIKSNLVSGLSYDPMNSLNEWIVFTLNIDTKALTGGSYRIYK